MKKKILLFIIANFALLFVCTSVFAINPRASQNVYPDASKDDNCNTAQDVDSDISQDEMRKRLHEKIKNPNTISYKKLWQAFAKTDPMPDDTDTVFDIYSYGTNRYSYDFFKEQCGNYKKEGDCYNREHSFPRSWWGGNRRTPMNSDLFHIYPTDGFINNQRASYSYAEVTDEGARVFYNGSKLGSSETPGYNGKAFEVIDRFKGDIARSYFYMVTAYYDKVSRWKSPMLTGNNLSPWAREMLIKWHKQDPVSEKEKKRNKAIKAIQKNYNPFIENQELVDAIWGQQE